MIRDTFYFGILGEIGEVSVVIATTEEWADSPESREGYNVVEDNGKVRACKLVLPMECLDASKPDRPHDWLAEMMACPRVKNCPDREKIATAKRSRHRKAD